MGHFFQFNQYSSGLEADYLALQNDWQMVGQDFEDAFLKI